VCQFESVLKGRGLKPHRKRLKPSAALSRCEDVFFKLITTKLRFRLQFGRRFR